MAPVAKPGGGGKSKSGASAAGGAAQAQPRTISTRSQKAGLQVRDSIYSKRCADSLFPVPRRTYSSISETANPA